MANLGTRKEQAGIADKPYYISGSPNNTSGNSVVEMINQAAIGTNVIPAGMFIPGKRIRVICEGTYTAPITLGAVVPFTINVRIGTDLFYQYTFSVTVASTEKDFWVELDVTNTGVNNGSICNTVATGRLNYTTASLDVVNAKKFNNTFAQPVNINTQMAVSVQAFYTIPNTISGATLLTYTITALKAQIITNF